MQDFPGAWPKATVASEKETHRGLKGHVDDHGLTDRRARCCLALLWLTSYERLVQSSAHNHHYAHKQPDSFRASGPFNNSQIIARELGAMSGDPISKSRFLSCWIVSLAAGGGDTHRRIMVARIGPVLRESKCTRRQTDVPPSIFTQPGLGRHIGCGNSSDLAGQGHMWHWKYKRPRGQLNTMAFA